MNINNAWGINATWVDARASPDATAFQTPGWLQYRECDNRGNCTLPGICTCEKGWRGVNCTEPICAQECLNGTTTAAWQQLPSTCLMCSTNSFLTWVFCLAGCTGGTCTGPDECECVVWPAKLIIDGRDVFKNGRNVPIFQRDDGEQQDTGWTGYDCHTRMWFGLMHHANASVTATYAHSRLYPPPLSLASNLCTSGDMGLQHARGAVCTARGQSQRWALLPGWLRPVAEICDAESHSSLQWLPVRSRSVGCARKRAPQSVTLSR